MKKMLTATIVAIAAVAAVAATAHANPLNVSASVSPSCTIENIGDITFASASSGVGGASSGSVTVTCTKSITYNIELDPGLNPDGGTGQRNMVHETVAAELLSYNLYQPDMVGAGGVQSMTLWGDDVALGIGASQAGTGTGMAESYTIFGEVPAGQVQIPGAYSDIVQLNVLF